VIRSMGRKSQSRDAQGERPEEWCGNKRSKKGQEKGTGVSWQAS